jgi:hypothetical protein
MVEQPKNPPVVKHPTVLEIVGREDRQDGDKPAWRVLSPCCRAAETLSWWVLPGAWINRNGLFDLRCPACGRWRLVRVPEEGRQA